MIEKQNLTLIFSSLIAWFSYWTQSWVTGNLRFFNIHVTSLGFCQSALPSPSNTVFVLKVLNLRNRHHRRKWVSVLWHVLYYFAYFVDKYSNLLWCSQRTVGNRGHSSYLNKLYKWHWRQELKGKKFILIMKCKEIPALNALGKYIHNGFQKQKSC